MRDRLFVVYIACNQLVCALVFLPWARRRETVCGLMGRWREEGNRWQACLGSLLCPYLDWVFHRNWDQCRDIWRMEEEARDVLYPPGH